LTVAGGFGDVVDQTNDVNETGYTGDPFGKNEGDGIDGVDVFEDLDGGSEGKGKEG
jgi:hypothetical protein